MATAVSIANTYPTSTRASYVAAASALRLPYWDWAAKPPAGNNLPNAVTTPSWTLTGPSGQVTVANPLLKHSFTSESTLVYSPFVHWPVSVEEAISCACEISLIRCLQATLRYPSSNAATATSNEQKDITAFNNIRGSLQDQLYQIFSTCDTYSEVGLDTASTGTVKCSNSLEGLHNTVHTTAGGPAGNGISGGHMTYLATAAFDPIFWLHHCNVDRLFAMWQTIYPNSYGASQVAPQSTWTIAKGTTVNAASPLTPFHSNSGGNFWTTTGVRNWRTFHYTYPEFVDSDGSAAAIKQYVNNLYGPNANAAAGSSKRDLVPELEDRAAKVLTPLIANNGSLFQYVANIETARYALNGSYNIFLFNGNPTSEDPAEWILDANLIGPMGVLASEAMSASNTVAQGSIPLTRTLSNVISSGAGLLADLTEANVVPYLVKNLQWRIAGPTGLEIDPASVPDFDISVFASTASQVSGSELPVWSEFIPLEDVTKDRSGTGSGSVSASSATSTSTATGVASAVTAAASKVTSVLSKATAAATRRAVRF